MLRARCLPRPPPPPRSARSRERGAERFSACPPGGYRLPQDVLKQTKLLFLLPIPPPAPQPSADVGGGLGQLCQDAPYPRGPLGGLPRSPREGRAVHLHVCKFLLKKKSDLLGNFSPLPLKCGKAQSIVISPAKLSVGTVSSAEVIMHKSLLTLCSHGPRAVRTRVLGNSKVTPKIAQIAGRGV